MANPTLTITAVEASGPGALSGYEVACTCGLTFRSSVEPTAEAQAHKAWHERQDGSR